jgi:4-amino-4-deoxy-L-arabinose transferase-like glycosyltransferase
MESTLERNKDKLKIATVFLTGFLVSLIICFLVFPKIQNSFNVNLDPDAYGSLGLNLWRGFGFSFEPVRDPTIYRGPLYPAFLALALVLTSGWFPQGIWIAQTLLYSLTCVLIYLTGKKLLKGNLAFIVGLGCALYPVHFWYVPRLWNEILVMFLLSGLFYSTILFVERNSHKRAISIGILIGLACLAKATFLPLIVGLPIVLFVINSQKKISFSVTMMLSALLLVAPWTIRNYALVKQIVPVHTGTGFNMKMGNVFAQNITKSPLSYSQIWSDNIYRIKDLTRDISGSRAERDLKSDKIYLNSALEDIHKEPSLIIKKFFVSGLMFWYIGESPSKTIILSIIKIPLLIVAFFGICKAIRLREQRSLPIIAIIIIYWISHLPFAPPGRLSAPIMPMMSVFAMIILQHLGISGKKFK